MRKMLLLFLLVFFLAACQSGVSEPPKPVLTINNKKIPYEIGTYSWYEKGKGVEVDTAEPSELVKDTDYLIVPAGSEWSIDSKHQPVNLEAGIWKDGSADFKKIKNNKMRLPEEKGTFIYVIHASWKEGDAIYAFQIGTK
ncbi:lipoprotein [Bacillus sp. B190/17]|uniref:Lipoprotein n=1 Tax=Bacillus lumedeiriae TaxID=3058829 RepID=A0ABW8IDX2_9BACI